MDGKTSRICGLSPTISEDNYLGIFDDVSMRVWGIYNADDSILLGSQVLMYTITPNNLRMNEYASSIQGLDLLSLNSDLR
jgi:hypothetical protein